MARTKPMLLVAHITCLLLASRAYCQEPSGDSAVRARESRLQLVDAETDLKMQKLELTISERAEEEAMVEVEKAKLHVAAAQKSGESDRVGFAKLEMKQAQIRLEMQKVRSEMERLEIQRAEARLHFSQAVLSGQPVKRARVQLEYVDELDVVIIRGSRKNVDKVRALIENAEQEQEERE